MATILNGVTLAAGTYVENIGEFPSYLFAQGEQGAWYDPSDLSTLFQDAAGTTPVTADGQPVGRMLDKSGRGNHATQSIDAARPTYKTSGGLHWLEFDGIDDFLQTGNCDLSASGRVVILAGIRKANNTLSTIVEFSNNFNNNNSTFAFLNNNNRFEVTLRGGGAAPYSGYGTSTSSAPETAVIAATGDFSVSGASGGWVPVLRKNGSSDRVTALALNSPTTHGNFGVFPLFIGRRGGSSLPFNGRLYSLIVRGGTTDLSAIEDAETWVNVRTGAY
jgi:hypothetical protein